MKTYDSYKDSGIEWIGEIPSHWQTKRFKYGINLVSERDQASNLPKVGLENIEGFTGRFLNSDSEFEGDGEIFKIGDILFGKLRPYLAKVYQADFTGKAVGDIFVFRTTGDFIPSFASKLFLSKNFIDLTTSSTFGAKMPRVSWEFIADQLLPIPSLQEQSAIASYLDRKTAEIDELIADKKRLLELYEEEKTAVINQAVTKGLNADAPMKDSGIEWLGEIPEHWKVKKLKTLVSKIGSGVTPSGGASVYQSSGIPLLRSQNIHFDGLKLEDVAYISEEIDSSMSNSRVHDGDVLLNITGASIGRCFFVPTGFGKGNVNQHVCIIRPKLEKIDTVFLYCILRSEIGQIQINLQQTGANREGLNFEQLKNFYFPIPNLIQEQQAIFRHIETECGLIDAKKLKTEKLIELLNEYRTALISEVVTGKVKVID